MASSFPAETLFLRECVRREVGDIGFSSKAQIAMRDALVSWSDVFQVLRSGDVVWSDKEEAGFTSSVVIGETCDMERIRLTLAWDSNEMHVLVSSVKRL